MLTIIWSRIFLNDLVLACFFRSHKLSRMDIPERIIIDKCLAKSIFSDKGTRKKIFVIILGAKVYS